MDEKYMSKVNAILLTVAIWLISCVWFVYYLIDANSAKGGYEGDPSFIVFFFIIFKLPLLFIALLVLIYIELIFFEARKKNNSSM